MVEEEDDAVDTDEDVVDLGDEGVEAAGDDATVAEGFDIGDPVENKEGFFCRTAAADDDTATTAAATASTFSHTLSLKP